MSQRSDLPTEESNIMLALANSFAALDFSLMASGLVIIWIGVVGLTVRNAGY